MKRKRLLQILSLSALVCIVLNLCACSRTKDYSKEIVGEWMISGGPGSYICFREDGKVDYDPGEGDGVDGSVYWSIDGEILKLTDEDHIVIAHIESLKGDRMVLQQTINGISISDTYERIG